MGEWTLYVPAGSSAKAVPYPSDHLGPQHTPPDAPPHACCQAQYLIHLPGLTLQHKLLRPT